MKQTKKVLLLLLALLFAVPVFAAEKESAYDRVMRTGVIRCGYAIWRPILFTDLNSGVITGLAHDMMEKAAEKLSLKVEWSEEVSYGTIIAGLETGRYDMICTGMYQNAPRSRSIAFTVPFLYSPMFPLVRVDETRIKGPADLNKPETTIAVLEGEAGSIFAHEAYPKAKFLAIPQLSDFALMYEEVAQKKADVSLAEMGSFIAYDKANPGKLKALNPNQPLAVFPVVMGLPPGDVRLKTAIDAAITEMLNDGTIDRLSAQYIQPSNAFLPVAKPYGAQK